MKLYPYKNKKIKIIWILSSHKSKKEIINSNAIAKKEISELQLNLNDSLKREKKLERKISKLAEFISNLQKEYQNDLNDNDELKNLIENYAAREKDANLRELRLKETVNTNEHLFKTLTSKYQDLQRL